jgi:HSP20 family protein
LSGERRQQKEQKNKKFHRIERSYGKFVRRLAVPTDADPQKVSAEFEDGVLNVHLPKSPTARPRSIDVKVS